MFYTVEKFNNHEELIEQQEHDRMILELDVKKTEIQAHVRTVEVEQETQVKVAETQLTLAKIQQETTLMQMKMQIELKRLELEMKRLEYNSSTPTAVTSSPPIPTENVTIPPVDVLQDNTPVPVTPPPVVQPKIRPVLQLNHAGEVIKRHDSLTAASRAVGGDRNTLSRFCRQNSGQSYRGYVWRFDVV